VPDGVLVAYGPLAVHNGGSRATAAASDHHVARPTFHSVSELSAESGVELV
jgi:hypothetical protein